MAGEEELPLDEKEESEGPSFNTINEIYVFHKARYEDLTREKARFQNKLQVKKENIKALCETSQYKYLRITREFLNYTETVEDFELTNRNIILGLNKFILDLAEFYQKKDESQGNIEELNQLLSAANESKDILEKKFKETQKELEKLKTKVNKYEEMLSDKDIKKVEKEVEEPRNCAVCGEDISDLPSTVEDCNKCYNQIMEEYEINNKKIPLPKIRDGLIEKTKKRQQKRV